MKDKKQTDRHSAAVRAKKAFGIIVANGGKKSTKKALLEAGFPPSIAKNPKRITSSKTWKDLLDKYLPEENLLKENKEGLMATVKVPQIVSRDEDGRPEYQYIEMPNHAVRHRYLETAYKIRGRLSPDAPIGQVIVPVIIMRGGERENTEQTIPAEIVKRS